MSIETTRRALMGGIAGAALANGAARAESAVTLNVVDIAGNLQLTRPAFENYQKANSGKVSKINFTQAPAPEIPGKIHAQQAANRVDIDLVLTGNDGLSAGIDQKLWVPLTTEYKTKLPDLDAIYIPAAKTLQTAALGQGVLIVTCPGGPIIEYMPDKVKNVPTTAEEVLAWAKQNSKKFMYARPANSGPGRAFMMGLPYILGDSNPKDPEKGWDKTWAYLEELGGAIEYYPTGTGAVMKEFGEGARDMIASHVGWDINPRVLGIVPKEAAITTMKGFHWIGDAHFICVPKGLPPEKMDVVLDLISYMLTPPAQAITYDKGYFYPGPAVKGVTLDMAPKASQDAIKEFGRKIYDTLIPDTPMELPLDADKMVYAFRRWDEQVGSKVAK